MKKLLFLLMIAVLLLSFTSCAVTDKSLSIAFANPTDKKVTLKIGNHTVIALAGGAAVIYVFKETKGASIEVKGISLETPAPPPDNDNPTSVDLTFGYQYHFMTELNDGKYNLFINAEWVGDVTDAPTIPPEVKY